MKKIGLTVYGVQISNNQKYRVDNADGSLDFIHIVERFGNSNKGMYDNDQKYENVFKFASLEKETIRDDDGHIAFNAIAGVVKTGDYGNESELVHSRTGETTYYKTPVEADVMPFVFYLAMSPIKKERGILIFQTEGKNGMKTAFESRIKKFVRQNYKGWKISLGNLMPKEYVERYLVKGFLKEIRMIKYGISNDISERNGIRGNNDEVYEERIIHNPLGFLDMGAIKIREVMKGQRALCNIVEIPDFDYDSLKFRFQMGKMDKTIDLSNLDTLVISEDITEIAGVNKGHPDVEVVKNEMRETAKGYMESMGLA